MNMDTETSQHPTPYPCRLPPTSLPCPPPLPPWPPCVHIPLPTLVFMYIEHQPRDRIQRVNIIILKSVFLSVMISITNCYLSIFPTVGVNLHLFPFFFFPPFIFSRLTLLLRVNKFARVCQVQLWPPSWAYNGKAFRTCANFERKGAMCAQC